MTETSKNRYNSSQMRIVNSVGYDPFKKKNGDMPDSTRLYTPNTSRVNASTPVPMTIRRTTGREQKEELKKSNYDFTPIRVVWKEDYNIISVHQQVLSYLKETKERKKNIEERIDALKISLKLSKNTNDISSAKIKINELEIQISKLEGLSYLDYCNSVNPLIHEYKRLSKVNPVIMGQEVIKNINDLSEKIIVIEKYLEEANRFCPMEIIRDFKTSNLCKTCSSPIVEKAESYMCSGCGNTQSKIEIQEEGDENDTFSSKKVGEDLNFRDLVLQFQMLFPVNIPDRITNSIKEIIGQYQNLSIESLTKADLVKIMKDLGLGSWYKHLNKIYFMLTGKEPTNITRYAENVVRRGMLFSKIYPDIKEEDRSNFLHGLHLIWLFLMNEGCHPDMDDFVLLKSRKVELSNLKVIEKGFIILRKRNPEFKWEIFEIP